MRGRPPRYPSLATSSDPYTRALGDVDGFWDDLTKAGKSVLGAVDEKGAKLEGALKLIILLSGIAAATGVVNVFLRRR